LIASRQPEGWRVDALGAPHTGDRHEADLIKAFADRLGHLRPEMEKGRHLAGAYIDAEHFTLDQGPRA
jgi:hypothetical protein